jgi:hypothetical protein
VGQCLLGPRQLGGLDGLDGRRRALIAYSHSIVPGGFDVMS